MTPNSVMEKTIRLDRPIIVAGFTATVEPANSDHPEVFLYHPEGRRVATIMWAFIDTAGVDEVNTYPTVHAIAPGDTLTDTAITHKEIVRGGKVDA